MACFEDYEVLSILGTNLNSTCYKVRNKITDEIFVWKAINFEKHQEHIENILEKVQVRKSLKHPSLLQFYDHILHTETETIYLVMEYCKHGSLFNVIKKCTKQNQYIDEYFIWNYLYKLACYFKLNDSVIVNLHDVFIDEELNIKLLNFTIDAGKCVSDIHDLGRLIQALVNLNEQYYSCELKSLLQFLVFPEEGVVPNVDAILCHPRVLLNVSSEKVSDIFVQNSVAKEVEKENTINVDFETMYQTKLENLRNRQSVLKANEEKLKERSLVLDRREKKVALMERIVKEKMARAELYLKRSRELKSTNNGSAKTQKKQLYENQDTSFSADCGDTSIVPTSRKLNVQEIIKPVRFTRTMSERRVRFKSHSPLKEIHNIRRLKIKYPDIKEHPKRELKAVLQSDSDKLSETNSDKCAEKGKKKFLLSMFNKKPKKPNSIASSSDSVSVHTYEDFDDLKDDVQPINWTQENKQSAFDLLRIMNSDNIEQIKHTYL